MADFEIKPQVRELVEKADKNRNRLIEGDEKKLDLETQRVAEKLRTFLEGNQEQKKALNKAILEVAKQYKGLKPQEIYQWIKEKPVEKASEKKVEKPTPLSIPETDEGSRRLGHPAEESVLEAAWEQMSAEERQNALIEGANALAEKEKIQISPEQGNRLSQLNDLVTLAEAYKSFIEKQKAESGISGALFQINVALNSFKSDPLKFLDQTNDFLRNKDKLSADILKNPTKPMAELLKEHEALFKTITLFTTPSFFGVDTGKGIDLTRFDCKTPEELNQLRSVVMGVLRDTNSTGGHFQTARQMALETLEPDFDKVMKSHFQVRKQSVRIGDLRVGAEVIGNLYDQSNAKIREKAPIAEWKQEIKKEDPNLSDAEIEKRIQEFIESLTYEDYQRQRNEAVGETIFENELFKKFPKDKLDVWDQYKDSMGFGKLDISDENWDTVLTEFMINAPLIIVSGGVASGARAIAAKGLSYGARAVVGGARMAKLAVSAGRAGRIGGRVAAGAAGLAFEGTVFEMTNAGFKGEWVFNSPDWAQRILWSSAALGIFKGAGKLGEKLAGKKGLLEKVMTKITNAPVRKGVETLIKSNIEVAAMLTLGAIQNGAYNGNVDDFMNNFGEELFKAYVSIGSLKVSGKMVESIKGKTIARPEEKIKTRENADETTPVEKGLRLKQLMQKLDPLNKKLDAQNRAAETQTLKRLAEQLGERDAAEFKEAFIDPMTGLLNRQGLRLLDQWIAKGEKVGVVSYDGDHFGAFNKVIGRNFGDLIIKHMSTQFHEMANRLRAKGYKAEAIRMGGEEFVIISDAPKDVLGAEMDTASASLKDRIRSLLSPSLLHELAAHIAAGKYGQEANGETKALDEIGGSSAGVTEVQLYTPKEGGRAREDLLQYVDEFLEHGKAQARGRTHLDSRDIARASSEVDRFRPKNRLTDVMNEHLEGVRSELNGDVFRQMEAKTPQTTRLLAEHPEQRTLLEEFLKSPSFDPRLEKQILSETRVGIEALRNAKREFTQAVRDHGTYTGAETPRFLERQLATGEFSKPRKLVVGEFKSINEIMGHTYGDTILTFTHQRVIREAIRLENLESQSIVAQDKADFLVSFRNSVPAEARARFEQTVQSLYSTRIQELFMRIDTGQVGPVESVRTEWLKSNKSSTLQDSLKAMYSLTIE